MARNAALILSLPTIAHICPFDIVCGQVSTGKHVEGLHKKPQFFANAFVESAGQVRNSDFEKRGFRAI
ncbi:hypothetical protein NG895_04315 [Aeoliella sp. ICT_H6.2]|uniref:Uncharacterized protein n=1 Tax=Aeoliella straminimaris TaxID=2954799 RepID=A0A9X2JEX3_9BACT|nr:hypothetical protein [Aeoliella straminimaris]MCO6043121.1 hypothetical protein [Aeoliella straminimaris]